jgi:hypothetical protein
MSKHQMEGMLEPAWIFSWDLPSLVVTLVSPLWVYKQLSVSSAKLQASSYLYNDSCNCNHILQGLGGQTL